MKRLLTFLSVLALFCITQQAYAQCGVVVNIDTNVTCAGDCDGSISAGGLTGTAPFTFNWSNGATTGFIGGLCAGAYTITVTDANGCTAVDSAWLADPAPLTLSVATNTGCGNCDASASASAGGGYGSYTYSWSTGAIGTDTVDMLCDTVYSVTVTDTWGCTLDTSFWITTPNPLAASLTPTNESCFSCCDGSIAATPIGGVAPYTYNWSNASTAATATGLCAGTYTVTITDANGCTTSWATILTSPPPPSCGVSINQTASISCNGACDGTLEALATGTAPFTYLWSDGSTGATTGACAGTYTVTVTDNLACTSTATITVAQPAPLTATTQSWDETCQGCCNGSVWANNVSGGVPPYSYSWMPSGATSAFVNGLCGNTGHGVTITDANGCMLVDSAFVNASNNLILAGYVEANSIGQDDAKVYLIDAVASGSTTLLTAIDSVDTDSLGYYEFSLTGGGTYYTKAALYSTAPLFSSYIPTYYGDEALWSNATGIVITTVSSLNNDIDMIAGTNAGGPGFVGGLVSQGANKTEGIGDPVVGAAVILTDDQGAAIAIAETDANGEYAFDDLPLGNYTLFVEILNKTSDPFPVELTADSPEFTDADFKVFDTFVDAATSATAPEIVQVRGLYPNPASEVVTLELDVRSDASADLLITNALGQPVYQQNLALLPGLHRSEIDLRQLPNGIYTIQVTGSEIRLNTRFVKH